MQVQFHLGSEYPQILVVLTELAHPFPQHPKSLEHQHFLQPEDIMASDLYKNLLQIKEFNFQITISKEFKESFLKAMELKNLALM